MKKITMLILAVVLAIGLLGVGYAKWSDTVTINGTVNTGTVKLSIFDVNTNDSGTTLDPKLQPNYTPWTEWREGGPQPPYDTTDMKHVASLTSTNNVPVECTCNLAGLGSRNFYYSVTETVVNAYPFYAPTTVLNIASCGTIPVKIEGITVTDPNAFLQYIEFHWNVEKATNYGNNWTTVGSGVGLADLGSLLTGIQLHTCDFVRIQLMMVFLQSSPQGANASFTITVTAAQYNEVN